MNCFSSSSLIALIYLKYSTLKLELNRNNVLLLNISSNEGTLLFLKLILGTISLKSIISYFFLMFLVLKTFFFAFFQIFILFIKLYFSNKKIPYYFKYINLIDFNKKIT